MGGHRRLSCRTLRDVRFEERPIHSALRPWVARLWAFEAGFDFGLERRLPSGLTELLINLDDDETRTYASPSSAPTRHAGTVVEGPRREPMIIDTLEQRRVVGVVFRPAGAAALLGVPARTLLRRHVALADLWGSLGANLRPRLLEAPATRRLEVVEGALLERLGPDLPDPAVVGAAAALEAGARVGEVLERVGMGRKRFGRCFEDAVGMTPKRFAGIRRFRRVLERAHALEAFDWASLALDCGYFDQSHLIADFGRYAGLTPSRYAPRSDDAIAHLAI